MNSFAKILKTIKNNDKYFNDFDSLNGLINYIEALPETKRASIWIKNTESSVSDIYDLFLSLEEDDDFMVSFLLLALINANVNAIGFSSIVREYEEVYPKASMIANSYVLSRSL